MQCIMSTVMWSIFFKSNVARGQNPVSGDHETSWCMGVHSSKIGASKGFDP